jgi:hypothetical protein
LFLNALPRDAARTGARSLQTVTFVPIPWQAFKNVNDSADARGVDQISAQLAAPVEVANRAVEHQKALSQAMIKLIEACASAGRDVLPADATFHTYA